MDRWLATNAQKLSQKVYRTTSEISGQEFMEADAPSPFAGFALDSRGPDATMFNWASAMFEARMQQAAQDLARRGFSLQNPPPFLSPDCFSVPAPDGFKI